MHDFLTNYATVVRKLLDHSPSNVEVHECGRIGKVARPRLYIEIQLFTFNHSRYRGINDSVWGWLFLRSHGVNGQLYGVQKHLFADGLDFDLETISYLTLYFSVDAVTDSSWSTFVKQLDSTVLV